MSRREHGAVIVLGMRLLRRMNIWVPVVPFYIHGAMCDTRLPRTSASKRKL